MDIRAIYRTLDIKNKMVIEKTCPKVELDGYTWYDTTYYGFNDEKRYLQSRGILVVHSLVFSLVRFVEQTPVKAEPPTDPKRALKRC
jgi:hypothetical protein